MTSVRIRELRQRASELLRRVEGGETIEISDSGRPVAVLSPLPESGTYQRLLAEGEIARASRDTGELTTIGRRAARRLLELIDTGESGSGASDKIVPELVRARHRL